MGAIKQRFPIYGRLARLYPRPYRRNYEEQTLQTLADMLDEAHSPVRRAAIWLRVGVDLPISISRQQLLYVGGIMTHDTPQYVKRNAIIGGALLTPFFMVIVSNGLIHGNLTSSNHWKKIFLTLLVIFPAVAFMLNAATFIRWATRRKVSFWKSIFDFKHNWPTILVTGLGLSIFLFVPFHDSAHCVTGNPVTELHHWSETWRCIQHG